MIEHTNFERPETYAGDHIVYLSKYLPHTEALYLMSPDEVLDCSLPYLKTMFPAFDRAWIRAFHVWKARWSQPVVEKHYSSLIPDEAGPLPGLHLLLHGVDLSGGSWHQLCYSRGAQACGEDQWSVSEAGGGDSVWNDKAVPARKSAWPPLVRARKALLAIANLGFLVLFADHARRL